MPGRPQEQVPSPERSGRACYCGAVRCRSDIACFSRHHLRAQAGCSRRMLDAVHEVVTPRSPTPRVSWQYGHRVGVLVRLMRMVGSVSCLRLDGRQSIGSGVSPRMHAAWLHAWRSLAVALPRRQPTASSADSVRPGVERQARCLAANGRAPGCEAKSFGAGSEQVFVVNIPKALGLTGRSVSCSATPNRGLA